MRWGRLTAPSRSTVHERHEFLPPATSIGYPKIAVRSRAAALVQAGYSKNTQWRPRNVQAAVEYAGARWRAYQLPLSSHSVTVHELLPDASGCLSQLQVPEVTH